MSTLRVIQPAPEHQPAHSHPHQFESRHSAELEKALREKIEGEVRFDAGSRGLYAVDASNYRQIPIGVVIPRSKDDVLHTVATCREFGAPILSRGGGTSLAGQCCNVAVVIDWTKYMGGVLEIDWEARRARVLPGTILDHLRKKAEEHHLTFGPDPATHNHCTIGGMLGNNSCGIHAQMAGKTVDNTDSLEILTYEGLRLEVGWMHVEQFEQEIRNGGPKGEIFGRIKSLRDRYADLIRRNYPNIPRRVSGYNLDQLLPDENGMFNMARALVGSEGTLVTILEAKLQLTRSPQHRVLVVVGYEDVFHAGDHVTDILPFGPIGLEGIDHLLIENIEKKGLHRENLPLLPEGKSFLFVEFGADTKQEAEERAHAAAAKIKLKGAVSAKVITDTSEQSKLWEVRESGLGATAFVPGEPITWEGWEDSAVPPERVGAYLRDLKGLYDKYGYIGALYGHFGMGCIHTRISFDLMSAHGVSQFRSFLEEATDLCIRHGGSLSGEHGDGQSRGEFLVKMFGPELMEAMREFKAIWDPQWKMNPGKVVEPFRIDQNLRLGADYHPNHPKTHFQFPADDGDFAHAALRCVGVGKCRRTEPESEVMCPSYMATKEEMHTTRGRAHLLWEMLQGDLIDQGWKSDHVREALDLCLACKGCKKDCPVNVDMATYKAEFLSHYYEGRLRPRSAYAFGLIDQWARIASKMPGLVNLATQTPGIRNIAKFLAGMPQERSIPEFAPYTFQSWVEKQNGSRRKRYTRSPHEGGIRRVVLWPDTFNNFFFPDTAQAAHEILQQAGFEVVVPRQHVCCGRPLYDFGMLDLAKVYLRRVMKIMEDEINAGTPFVVLEPSCASVFRDELHGLFPHDELSNRLQRQTYALSEFLEQKAKDFPLPKMHRKAVVQGHCHHKSILDMSSEEKVLKRMEMEPQIMKTGCCGMAGSFGFEKDKYEVSIQVGEHDLLPRICKTDFTDVIVADGFSCREQIAQGTDRQALHLAEVLKLAQETGVSGPRGLWPEKELVEQRKRERRQARSRAALGVAAFGIAAGAAWWLIRSGRKQQSDIDSAAA